MNSIPTCTHQETYVAQSIFVRRIQWLTRCTLCVLGVAMLILPIPNACLHTCPFTLCNREARPWRTSVSSRFGLQFANSGLLSSRSFGTSCFCTGSNVFTLRSYQKGKMIDDRCVAMCRSQILHLGPLDKRCAIRLSIIFNSWCYFWRHGRWLGWWSPTWQSTLLH